MSDTAIPATRDLPRNTFEASEIAGEVAARRFVLESFRTTDGETVDPDTGQLAAITVWGVFDVENRDDGRNGMVWRPRSVNSDRYGFLADPDHAAAEALLHEHRALFVAEAVAAWVAIADQRAAQHQVIRLDNGHADDPAYARLHQLTARYDAAKREADAAAEALKEITDGIKAETRALHPTQEDFTIVAGSLAHPLTLQRVRRQVFDSVAARKILTEEQWTALCKTSESWVLKAKRG